MTGTMDGHDPPIATYRGAGRLVIDDGMSVAGGFDARQLASGQITVHCQVEQGSSVAWPPVAELAGVTDDGGRLRATGLRYAGAATDTGPVAAEGAHGAYTGERMAVAMGAGAPAAYRYAVYGLTNFLFVPDVPSPLPGDDRSPTLVLLLDLHHGGRRVEVVVRPVRDYATIARALTEAGGVALTSEVFIRAEDAAGLRIADAVAEGVAGVLARLGGASIALIYRSLEDDAGRVSARSHVSGPGGGDARAAGGVASEAGGQDVRRMIEAAFRSGRAVDEDAHGRWDAAPVVTGPE